MNKKLLLLPLSALMVFMVAGLVNAAVSCAFDQTATTAGTKSTYINGATLNISATATAQANSGENVTVGILSNDVTSTTYVFNSSGGTANVSQVNASVNTAEFVDTQVVTFTWTLKNLSQGTTTTCTRAYITDNTEPGCSFASVLKNSETYAPTQKWTVSCSNASTATLKFGSNTPINMVESSDSCTFTGDKGKVPEGTYQTLIATTSDGLNTTQCSLSSIRIEIGIPLKQVAALAASGSLPKTGSGSSGGSDTTVIWVLVAIGLIWWYRNRKNK